MAKVKNTVIEKYDSGRVAILDLKGVVREVPDHDYEIGQCLFVDVEAIDMACAIMSKEGTKRAMAGDFDPQAPTIKSGLKMAMVRHVFPIAASFTLALIFGVGGGVYAAGEVSKTVETEGVSYDMNYFNRVIGVHIDEVKDEDLSELKREIHGKSLDDAKVVIEEKKKKDELEVPQTKEQDTVQPSDTLEVITQEEEEEPDTKPEEEEPDTKPEETVDPEPKEDFGSPRENMENPPEAMEDNAIAEPERNDMTKRQKMPQDADSDDFQQEPDMEGEVPNRSPEEKDDGQKDMPTYRENEIPNDRQDDLHNDMSYDRQGDIYRYFRNNE